MNAQAKAQHLINQGYRPLSNKYRSLSRLDRSDWKEAMAADRVKGFPGDPKENHAKAMEWVNGLKSAAADHYRARLSKDHITVDETIYRIIKQNLRDREVQASHGWGNLNEYIPRDYPPAKQRTEIEGTW